MIGLDNRAALNSAFNLSVCYCSPGALHHNRLVLVHNLGILSRVSLHHIFSSIFCMGCRRIWLFFVACSLQIIDAWTFFFFCGAHSALRRKILPFKKNYIHSSCKWGFRRPALIFFNYSVLQSHNVSASLNAKPQRTNTPTRLRLKFTIIRI